MSTLIDILRRKPVHRRQSTHFTDQREGICQKQQEQQQRRLNLKQRVLTILYRALPPIMNYCK